jgi:hypothetical protein
MAYEAGDGTIKDVGIAQKLGKEGHLVTRVGQSRAIVWDAFLRGSYARQRARTCIIHVVYKIPNECQERDHTTNTADLIQKNYTFESNSLSINHAVARAVF